MTLYDSIKGRVWTAPKNFVLRKTEETAFQLQNITTGVESWGLRAYNDYIVSPDGKHQIVGRGSIAKLQDALFQESAGGKMGRVDLELNLPRLNRRKANTHYWVEIKTGRYSGYREVLVIAEDHDGESVFMTVNEYRQHLENSGGITETILKTVGLSPEKEGLRRRGMNKNKKNASSSEEVLLFDQKSSKTVSLPICDVSSDVIIELRCSSDASLVFALDEADGEVVERIDKVVDPSIAPLRLTKLGVIVMPLPAFMEGDSLIKLWKNGLGLGFRSPDASEDELRVESSEEQEDCVSHRTSSESTSGSEEDLRKHIFGLDDHDHHDDDSENKNTKKDLIKNKKNIHFRGKKASYEFYPMEFMPGPAGHLSWAMDRVDLGGVGEITASLVLHESPWKNYFEKPKSDFAEYELGHFTFVENHARMTPLHQLLSRHNALGHLEVARLLSARVENFRKKPKFLEPYLDWLSFLRREDVVTSLPIALTNWEHGQRIFLFASFLFLFLQLDLALFPIFFCVVVFYVGRRRDVDFYKVTADGRRRGSSEYAVFKDDEVDHNVNSAENNSTTNQNSTSLVQQVEKMAIGDLIDGLSDLAFGVELAEKTLHCFDWSDPLITSFLHFFFFLLCVNTTAFIFFVRFFEIFEICMRLTFCALFCAPLLMPHPFKVVGVTTWKQIDFNTLKTVVPLPIRRFYARIPDWKLNGRRYLSETQKRIDK